MPKKNCHPEQLTCLWQVKEGMNGGCSLGARPRDLQFCKPVLKMLFEVAILPLRPVGPIAKRPAQPGRAGTSNPQICPSAVGAAHFHLNLHQYPVEKTFPAQPC